jgi:hypothetical protein
MSRSSDNLVSPFVDGELPASETRPGDLGRVLRGSPFASLNLAHRLGARSVEAAPPPPPVPAIAEVEPAPISEVVFEVTAATQPETTEPEAAYSDLEALALLPEGGSWETTEAIAPAAELLREAEPAAEAEPEAPVEEAAPTDEMGFDLAAQLQREMEDVLELEVEPELEPEIALELEILEPDTPEGEEQGADQEAVEQEDETPQGTVIVILDEPTDPDDRFTLKNRNGGYTKTLSVKSAKAVAAGVKALHFDITDTTKEYELLHKRSGASAERRILPPTPFPGFSLFHERRKQLAPKQPLRARALVAFTTRAPDEISGRPLDPALREPWPGLRQFRESPP